MQEYLSDLEIDKIEKFCADTEQFNAVKKVLLKTLYKDGVLDKERKVSVKNGAFNFIAYNESSSNEEVGANLRALFKGVNELEEGFSVLKTVKKEDKSVLSPLNEAI